GLRSAFRIIGEVAAAPRAVAVVALTGSGGTFPAMRGLAALTARFGRQLMVLGEAAIFGSHAGPALARDLALFILIHGGESAVGRRRALLLLTLLLVLSHCSLPCFH